MSGFATWRRAHRPIVERTAALRADRYKYGYLTCRMVIERRVHRFEFSGDVTLAAVGFLGEKTSGE